LMQVMPDTGNWIAGELGIEEFDPEMLYDPITNLNVGHVVLGVSVAGVWRRPGSYSCCL